MNQHDVAKLLDKGFTVLRTANIYPAKNPKDKSFQIKAKTKDKPDWYILEKDIPSQAQLDRRIKELLIDPMTVLIL